MAKGTVFLDGKVFNMEFPVETHHSELACSLDMIRKINEYSPMRRFILKIVLGRYAWNELVLLRNAIEKSGYDTAGEYMLEDVKYNQSRMKW